MVTQARLEKIKKLAANRQKGLVVVLEDVNKLHNAQAIFRTCDVFGVHDIYMVFNKQDKYNPLKNRGDASSGAKKWVNIHTSESITDCLEDLKSQGFVICATIVDKNAQSIFEADFSDKKIAIVIGNEVRGISKEAQKLVDLKITIPMLGITQSLNVSVATAIFLYEVTRQRNQLGIDDFILSNKEQVKLIKELTQTT